ncbi:fibrous sheath CABYR-binding protein-like [Uloborus diversus]|uniref:fibrous sheath CABYR-binding protein-like n=1 Tax=Uloborus diversus TaxID=327109 RepID=UPI002409C9AD|nr:fibrous sheath CABYR-binding protein-like [Uloborus diversus]
MKEIIICFVAFLALATATPLCEKASDCKDDECCVALSALAASRKGVCVKLRRERQRCSPPESQLAEEFYGGKYLQFCPCQQSLECVTKPPSKLYRCQKQAATTAGPDQTTAPREGTTGPADEGTTPPAEEETTPPADEETTPTTPAENEDNNEETPDETPDEETPDETPDEETPDETPNEETPDETPEEETPNEEAPPQGPGGEPPRDDDCADWELPC